MLFRSLVDIGVDGFGRGAFERFRGREVGEALGEVGSSVASGEASHLADDGFRKVGDAGAAEARTESGCCGRHSLRLSAKGLHAGTDPSDANASDLLIVGSKRFVMETQPLTHFMSVGNC